MNAHIIQMVQQSWAKVLPIAPQAAGLFYSNLFSMDPSLKPMFRGDMQTQGAKLMAMIGAAVHKLEDLDTLIPVLQGLGRRHDTYGVKPAHYDTVGAALLKTLEQGLGEDFTLPVRAAWAHVYGVMVSVMQEACEIAEVR